MTTAASPAESPASGLAGIGQLLSRRRVEKGMTVEAVASELHLQVRQVAALERGDFSGFSSPAFVKGYLRACARLYGVDGDVLVHTYDSFLPELKTYTPAVVMSPERIILASRRSNRAIILAGLIVFSIAAVIGFLLWFFSGGSPISLPYKSNDSFQPTSDVGIEPSSVSGTLAVLDDMVVADMPVAASPQTNSALQSEGNKSVMAPNEPSMDSVLHIEFIDDCWVQLKSDDGKVVHEKVHKKGEIFEMSVKTPLHVWFGRAGAVNVSYNGAAVPVPVKPGFQSPQFVLGDELPSSGTE
jgi:cytoskeleton protein RodZ